jgi:hypothetical protein
LGADELHVVDAVAGQRQSHSVEADLAERRLVVADRVVLTALRVAADSGEPTDSGAASDSFVAQLPLSEILHGSCVGV